MTAPVPTWLTDPAAASDPTWHLGDQLQVDRTDLRKGNALVQSPDFVVDFLLDRTLTPAIGTFGLAGTNLVDPACGTGHILTAAFMRLAARWWQLKPTDTVLTVPERAGLAQIALHQVAGVDIDPDCVDLARQRLTTLADQLGGYPPGTVPWRIHVACADSLMHGPDSDGYVPGPNHRCDDRDCQLAVELLGRRSYAAVVANPPYITVKDKTRNAAYRARYRTCAGTYALSVPFAELTFGLAHRGTAPAESTPADEAGGALS